MDHNMRPFWHASQSATREQYCLGPLPKHAVGLQYCKQFHAKYRDHDVPTWYKHTHTHTTQPILQSSVWQALLTRPTGGFGSGPGFIWMP